MREHLFMGGPLDGEWIATSGNPEYVYPEPDGADGYRLTLYSARRIGHPQRSIAITVYVHPLLPLDRETARIALGRWEAHYLPKPGGE